MKRIMTLFFALAMILTPVNGMRKYNKKIKEDKDIAKNIQSRVETNTTTDRKD